ncbi:MAG: TonB family protein [Cellvibrionaceae bacterium]|nr:TonB family protein [Cellvibrionaceae bacterium]
MTYQPVEKTQGAQAPGEQGIIIGLKKLTPPAAAKPAVAPKPPRSSTPTHSPKSPKSPKSTMRPTQRKPKVGMKSAPGVIAEAEARPEPVVASTDTVVPIDKRGKSAEEAPSMPTLSGGGDPQVSAAYKARLLAWLEAYKRYPSVAKRRGQEDTLVLEFTIDAQGHVISYTLSKPSRYHSLNRAVEKMIQQASPVVAVPAALRGNQTAFTFVVPIRFQLR